MCECLIENVPETNESRANFILLLNIVVSGLGTYVIGRRENPSNNALFKTALFQFLLSFVVFGWFWSVYWGLTLVHKSKEESSSYVKLAKVDNEKGPEEKAPETEKQ